MNVTAERVGRVPLGEDAHDEDADQRGNEADRGVRDGEEHRVEARDIRDPERGRRERDRRDDRADVRLEDVGAEAGDVADVVTDVVGDRGRVARVILGDAGLDLAHQVGADVGGLGVDAATHAREERDRARPHREARDDLAERLEAGRAEELLLPHEDPGDADEAERGHREAHHRAATEGDAEGGGLAGRAGRFGRAHVRLGRRRHARVARGHGADAAHDVGDAGRHVDRPGEEAGDDEQERQQHRVLALEEGHRALVDLLGQVLHGLRAGGVTDDAQVGQVAGHEADHTDHEGVHRQVVEHGGVGKG
jgi:hypothetical protein